MADKVREAGCPDGYGDRHAAKCENAVVAARVIEGAWGDGYIAGRRAALAASTPTDKVREAAERWASSEVDAYPGRTLEDRIKSWMAGGVHPDDVEWFLIDAYEAGYRAALAAPSGGDATRDEAVVARIRDYVVAAIETCREAEKERLSDMGKRAENHQIMPMLREQRFAWSEKAKSYDALLRFIDDAQRGAR